MNRRRVLDVIRFPAFLLAWTAGTVLATLHLQPAGALPVAATTLAWEGARDASARSPDRDLPAFDDHEAWSAAMAHLARHSEVINGSWQPASRRSVPPVHPVAVVNRLDRPADEAADRLSAKSPAVDERLVKSPAARFARFGTDKSRARDALRSGRFAEAYALLRPRVSEARHDSEYLGLLALAAMRLGSHGEAMVLYQRLAAIEPDSGRWRMGLALAQESLGLDATAEYQQALALAEDPDGMRSLLSAHLDGGGIT